MTPEEHNREHHPDLMGRLDRLVYGVDLASRTDQAVLAIVVGTGGGNSIAAIHALREGNPALIRAEMRRVPGECGATDVREAAREEIEAGEEYSRPVEYALHDIIEHVRDVYVLEPDPAQPYAPIDREKTHPVSFREARRRHSHRKHNNKSNRGKRK